MVKIKGFISLPISLRQVICLDDVEGTLVLITHEF